MHIKDPLKGERARLAREVLDTWFSRCGTPNEPTGAALAYATAAALNGLECSGETLEALRCDGVDLKFFASLPTDVRKLLPQPAEEGT